MLCIILNIIQKSRIFQKNLHETVFFVRIAYVVCGMSPVDAGCTEGNDELASEGTEK